MSALAWVALAVLTVSVLLVTSVFCALRLYLDVTVDDQAEGSSR
jgi:hypothetical protein